MTFGNQLASVAVRGKKWSDDVQTITVRAHTEYVQARITDDNDTSNPDFDAIARVLNAVKGLSLRTAHTLSGYIAEHGPYAIKYETDAKTKRKRFYVKLDKSETAVEFKDMTVAWNDWDNPKAELELKGTADFIKMIERIANDTDNKRNKPEAVSAAVIALHAVQEAQAKAA